MALFRFPRVGVAPPALFASHDLRRQHAPLDFLTLSRDRVEAFRWPSSPRRQGASGSS
jgi:hypothetical protein